MATTTTSSSNSIDVFMLRICYEFMNSMHVPQPRILTKKKKMYILVLFSGLQSLRYDCWFIAMQWLGRFWNSILKLLVGDQILVGKKQHNHVFKHDRKKNPLTFCIRLSLYCISIIYTIRFQWPNQQTVQVNEPANISLVCSFSLSLCFYHIHTFISIAYTKTLDCVHTPACHSNRLTIQI